MAEKVEVERAFPEISDPNKVEEFLNTLEKVSLDLSSSDVSFEDIFSD